MIDNFRQFELNSSTYDNTSNIAFKYGQVNKSKKLADWSDIGGISDRKRPADIGEILFDFNLIRRESSKPPESSGYTTIIGSKIFIGTNSGTRMHSSWDEIKRMRLNHTDEVILEGPIKGYITGINIKKDTLLEGSQQLVIQLQTSFLDKKNVVITKQFPIIISIPIKWEIGSNTEQTFRLDNIIHISTSDISDPKLYDRISATRFKKILSNISNYYPIEMSELSDYFKDFSYATEYEKLLNLLKNYSVNRLYDHKGYI
jgi:hypothetical protein